jgi:hypothetical protein
MEYPTSVPAAADAHHHNHHQYSSPESGGGDGAQGQEVNNSNSNNSNANHPLCSGSGTKAPNNTSATTVSSSNIVITSTNKKQQQNVKTASVVGMKRKYKRRADQSVSSSTTTTMITAGIPIPLLPPAFSSNSKLSKKDSMMMMSNCRAAETSSSNKRPRINIQSVVHDLTLKIFTTTNKESVSKPKSSINSSSRCSRNHITKKYKTVAGEGVSSVDLSGGVVGLKKMPKVRKTYQRKCVQQQKASGIKTVIEEKSTSRPPPPVNAEESDAGLVVNTNTAEFEDICEETTDTPMVTSEEEVEGDSHQMKTNNKVPNNKKAPVRRKSIKMKGGSPKGPKKVRFRGLEWEWALWGVSKQ